jgi:hypothetical protein
VKYDPKHEQALAKSLGQFFEKVGNAGKSIESVGKNIMKTGCSMMILALIGIILFAVIF